jgi:hypothetical protein
MAPVAVASWGWRDRDPEPSSMRYPKRSQYNYIKARYRRSGGLCHG